MRLALFGTGVLIVALAGPSFGAAGDKALGEASGLQVDELSLCAAIKDRSPVGVADTFPADIYCLYCYTRIVGASDTVAVRHIWYRGDSVAAERRLAVRSSPWRTWSSKEMRKEWKGNWKVDVVGPDGAVLASKKFYLR